MKRIAKLARQIRLGKAENIPSPCLAVCRMQADNSLCVGCFRTLTEIAAWSSMDDQAKHRVWASIEHRSKATVV